MKANYLVSIIIPAYNVEDYILTTIDSVIAQTYDNWELLIVDDASTDNTVAIVEKLMAEVDNVRLLKLEENSGAGIARNLGIREAKGRYIAFLDADDWWYPTKLEEQITFMQENSYAFTFTSFEYADNALNVIGVSHKPERISYWGILSGNNIGTPGVVIDTEITGKVYMPKMRESEDWALWISLINKVGYAYSINKPLWKYRDHEPQHSRRKLNFLKSNLVVYNEVLGLPKIVAVCMLVFLFIPVQVLKKLYNKVDSWIYMKNK